jgi:hypothetical protein
MATISEIQQKLKQFNQYTQQESPDPTAYKKRWKELFNKPLSSQSAHSFATYYKDMRSNTQGSRGSRKNRRNHASRKQRGGAAPLEYVMSPGLNIQTYGRFPVEAGTDPASVRNLDVYFRDSLTADCGVKDSSLQVPANMGSNQVGGRRRRRTIRRRRGRNSSRKFRQRGGDLLESITARVPFVHNASVAPNMLQSAQNAYTGGTQAVPAPADPAAHTWEPRTHGIAGLINPGIVAYVPNDVGKLSNPAPWMTSS